MKAITLRNIPGELTRKIEKKASQTHTSLNRTVISLLEESLGHSRKHNKKSPIYHDLDHLAGCWGKSEASRFKSGLDKMRRIDSELWR